MTFDKEADQLSKCWYCRKWITTLRIFREVNGVYHPFHMSCSVEFVLQQTQKKGKEPDDF